MRQKQKSHALAWLFLIRGYQLLQHLRRGSRGQCHFSGHQIREVEVFFDFSTFVTMLLRFLWLVIYFWERMFGVADCFGDDFQGFSHSLTLDFCGFEVWTERESCRGPSSKGPLCFSIGNGCFKRIKYKTHLPGNPFKNFNFFQITSQGQITPQIHSPASARAASHPRTGGVSFPPFLAQSVFRGWP